MAPRKLAKSPLRRRSPLRVVGAKRRKLAVVKSDPNRDEVNSNTVDQLYPLIVSGMDNKKVGTKVRAALKAALKATVAGKQSDKQIEADLDKAQYAFNRYLSRVKT